MTICFWRYKNTALMSHTFLLLFGLPSYLHLAGRTKGHWFFSYDILRIWLRCKKQPYNTLNLSQHVKLHRSLKTFDAMSTLHEPDISLVQILTIFGLLYIFNLLHSIWSQHTGSCLTQVVAGSYANFFKKKLVPLTIALVSRVSINDVELWMLNWHTE